MKISRKNLKLVNELIDVVLNQEDFSDNQKITHIKAIKAAYGA